MVKFMKAADYAAQRAAEEQLAKQKLIAVQARQFKSAPEMAAIKTLTPEDLEAHYMARAIDPKKAISDLLAKQAPVTENLAASTASPTPNSTVNKQQMLKDLYDKQEAQKAIDLAKQKSEADTTAALGPKLPTMPAGANRTPLSMTEALGPQLNIDPETSAFGPKISAPKPGMFARDTTPLNEEQALGPSIVDKALEKFPATSSSPFSQLTTAQKAGLGMGAIGLTGIIPKPSEWSHMNIPQTLPAGYGSESDVDERRMISGGENVDGSDLIAPAVPREGQSVDINKLLSPPVRNTVQSPSVAQSSNVGTATGYSGHTAPATAVSNEPGFFSKLFSGSGGDYQSNSQPSKIDDKSINWGNSDSSSDFFRADKLATAKYLADQAAQKQDQPEDRKSGGAVGTKGLKKDDAIHHALKIISHLVGHK